MPSREMSTVVAIVVACVMLFSVTPFSVLADSGYGSRTSCPVENDCAGSTQDSQTGLDANPIEGATFCHVNDLKYDVCGEAVA